MNILECFMGVTLLLSCGYTQKTPVKSVAYATGDDPDMRLELIRLKNAVASLSKQVMMQQNAAEERSRKDGTSGVKVVRMTQAGLKNYDSASHLKPAAFTIHDHSNYDRTAGLGEMSVMMNGVDFTTRHNDYKLVMPSTTSGEYHAYEDIPFPKVPKEVLAKTTLQDQINEMREWFKAFSKQDTSIRDYTKYFKPVLCYLEATWTLDKELSEPFPSDRHSLEAKSWEDLHQRFRFTAYTGTKSRLENIAFLPTSINSVNMTTGESQYAQWNYRILCHPVERDIPFSYLIQQNDLTFRVDTGQTMAETFNSRAARFRLFDPTRQGKNQILDDIFAKIPGKDNYGSNLTFTVFGESIFDSAISDQNVLLNTAYYHRSYKSFKNGAGGITYSALGFNDENLWVAQTSQPRVAPIETEKCINVPNKYGKLVKQCSSDELRVSYALPLELIYLTPIQSWNPYKIVYHTESKISTKDGRNGNRVTQALNGIDKDHYYMTPAEFYTGNVGSIDPADTVKNYMYVDAPDGQAKKVSASGVSIIMQKIEGIGKIRLRYPIAPVCGEGSSVWKELNALKDTLPDSTSEVPPTRVQFQMSPTVQDPPGEHTHFLTVTLQEYSYLISGQTIEVTTDYGQEHSHDLKIVYDTKKKMFRYTLCDGDPYCMDGHAQPLTLETINVYTELP